MSRPVIKQLSLFDANTGEFIMSKTLDDGSQNEGEWIIMYRYAIGKLLQESPNYTTMKVFLLLMQMQEYDDVPIKTTKKAVADILDITYYHVHAAFQWLEDNNYIVETKSKGQTQFDLNPNVTTCGKNRKKKLQRWLDLTSSNNKPAKEKLTAKKPPNGSDNVLDLRNIQ